MKWNTKKIVFMGLMVSMSIILTRLLSFMVGPTIRISFGDVPIILSGIVFGPVAGAITGIAADLVGYLLRSEGGFFFGFTLSAALTGFIPGLFFLRQKGEKYSLVKLIIIVVVQTILVSLTLNTFWLVIMYGQGFWAILPNRIIARAIIAPLEVLFLVIILRALNRYRTSH